MQVNNSKTKYVHTLICLVSQGFAKPKSTIQHRFALYLSWKRFVGIVKGRNNSKFSKSQVNNSTVNIADILYLKAILQIFNIFTSTLYIHFCQEYSFILNQPPGTTPFIFFSERIFMVWYCMVAVLDFGLRILVFI